MRWLKTRKNLLAEIADIENRVVERERRAATDDRVRLIGEYENKIISASLDAAAKREAEIMKIVEARELRIRDLENEIIKLKTEYRDFRDDVQEYEILTQTIETALKASTETTAQLAAKFQGISDKMQRLAGKFDRKHIKMVDGGTA